MPKKKKIKNMEAYHIHAPNHQIPIISIMIMVEDNLMQAKMNP